MELSEHFTLEEMVASETARRQGINNQAPPHVVEELEKTAMLLEKIRTHLGDAPMRITSGFRCQRLNSAVGGVVDSAHLYGQAADFIVPEFGSPLEICLALKPHAEELEFDQLIHESAWVHVGRRFGTQRKELWTIMPGLTKPAIP